METKTCNKDHPMIHYGMIDTSASAVNYVNHPCPLCNFKNSMKTSILRQGKIYDNLQLGLQMGDKIIKYTLEDADVECTHPRQYGEHYWNCPVCKSTHFGSSGFDLCDLNCHGGEGRGRCSFKIKRSTYENNRKIVNKFCPDCGDAL